MQNTNRTNNLIGGAAAFFCIAFVLLIFALPDSCGSEYSDAIPSSSKFISKSKDLGAEDYFRHIPYYWNRLQIALLDTKHSQRIIHKEGMVNTADISKDTDGKYMIHIFTNTFGSTEGGGDDLGYVGRNYAEQVLSEMLWLCGDNLSKVAIIRADLHTYDSTDHADYVVSIRPDETFYNNWNTWEDTKRVDLLNRINLSMKLEHDSATGKRWHR